MGRALQGDGYLGRTNTVDLQTRAEGTWKLPVELHHSHEVEQQQADLTSRAPQCSSGGM